MKKIIAIILIVCSLFCFAACDGSENHRYYAVIKSPDGEIIRGEIDNYNYGDAHITVYMKNGTRYITGFDNVLIERR